MEQQNVVFIECYQNNQLWRDCDQWPETLVQVTSALPKELSYSFDHIHCDVNILHFFLGSLSSLGNAHWEKQRNTVRNKSFNRTSITFSVGFGAWPAHFVRGDGKRGSFFYLFAKIVLWFSCLTTFYIFTHLLIFPVATARGRQSY